MRPASRFGISSEDLAFGRGRDGDLASLLDRAVAEEIITFEQAAAIEELQPERTPLVQRGRVPLYAEVFGYLGSILVVVGAISLVAQFWDDFNALGRLLVLGAAAVVLWGVGALIDEDVDPALWRLRSVMWLLSTAALGWFAAILAIDGFGWEGEPVTLMAGTSVAVVSATLWRLQDRPAQQLSTLAGAAIAVGAGAAWADGAAAVGIGLWLLGALWMLGGLRGILLPGLLALPFGAGLTLLGAGVTIESWEGFGQLFGLATAAALLGLGAARGRFWLTGAGVVGLLVYVPSTATYYFADTIGVPVTLLLSGVVLLAAALYTFRHRTTLVDLTGGDQDPQS